MPELLLEDGGLPKPQYVNDTATGFEEHKGKEGAAYSYTKEGHNVTLGRKDDAEVPTGSGTVVGIIKALRTKLDTLIAKFDGSQSLGTVNVGNHPTSIEVSNQPTALGVNNFPAGFDANNLTTELDRVFGTGKSVGNVDVSSLPALPAGTNNIGDVGVASLPSLPAGTNTIGKVDVNNIYVPSAKVGSLFGAVTVGAAAVELKVGGSALANRKAVVVFNNAAADIFVGFNNTVTTTNGIPIKAGTERRFDVLTSEALTLYAIATADSDVRIQELV